MYKVPFWGPEDFSGIWNAKYSFQGPEESGRLFRHGNEKKSNSKDIMLEHS
jgi:hypothetical protein